MLVYTVGVAFMLREYEADKKATAKSHPLVESTKDSQLVEGSTTDASSLGIGSYKGHN
jgi:hypothetical protein